MLNTDQIIRIIQEVCLRQKIDLATEVVQSLDLNSRQYDVTEFNEFVRDLTESGHKANLQMLEYALPLAQFMEFLSETDQPVLVFRRDRETFLPQLIEKTKDRWICASISERNTTESEFSISEISSSYFFDGDVRFITSIKLENLVSPKEEEKHETPTPMWRFIKLLTSEKKDIVYILFYAIVVGMISLVLPLGIQTTMELISGGLFFSSVYILIAAVIIGVLMAGGLQVFQITLVEYLQRRVFTKAAFEFAYRLPRLRYDSINKHYAPELVNRFFDVLTIQKGLPKFLIEFSGAAIQIMFGLLLLSLYHPSFVFFGVALVSVLFLIFYLLGPRGLKTSIMESKYKYQVIHWLEDVGRAIQGFKITGSTHLPIRKTDYFVNNYLKNRKNHFTILLTQFGYIILFKALTIGGLLIIGTNLVVAREITLGQFVASEVIIILILNSVEKIIMYTDVVYDLLTAVDKIGMVTDLPLEKRGGVDMLAADVEKAFSISVKNLSLTHEGQSEKALNNVTFNISGGSKVCLAGLSNSGKSTLINVLTGLLPDYRGSASVSGYSLRDLDLTFYRDHLTANGSSDEVFDGTWLENISMGNPAVNIQAVMHAIKLTGLIDIVNKLPQGLDTRIISSGLGLPASIVQKILLARCLAHPSRLTIVHDYFAFFSRKEKLEVMHELLQLDSTVIFVSNDAEVMATCDQVIILDDGKLKATGHYRDLLTQGLLEDYKISKN